MDTRPLVCTALLKVAVPDLVQTCELEFGFRRDWGPSPRENHIRRAEVVWPAGVVPPTSIADRCERAGHAAQPDHDADRWIAAPRSTSRCRLCRTTASSAVLLASTSKPCSTRDDDDRCHPVSPCVALCCRGSRTFRGPLRHERRLYPQARRASSRSADQLTSAAEVSGYLVGSPAFKAGGRGDPTTAGSIPVHLRQLRRNFG